MLERSFSSLERESYVQKLSQEEFDLVIIGGGATGCGIALDAASRGLKTALIEKKDFASGTSSKSTKLIHGGLRYLKQLDIGLVRETGTERAIVHKLAPHLVLPEKMIMPLVENGNYGYLSTSFGLWVYDKLAKVNRHDRRKMLNRKETLALEPLLSEAKLKGSGFYAEYRTDDARLVIELIKSAHRYGATAINYCELVDFEYDEKGIVSKAVCLDKINQKQIKIKAKKIVSASGPWVDLVRKKDKSLQGKSLHLTKGVHLVLAHEKFPLKHTTYFDCHDGRMIFAVPRNNKTYVGTSDTTYKGDLDKISVTIDDIDYLLKAIHHVFPKLNITHDDISSSWVGLRPLIHEDGKSPSELSRKDEIFVSDSGLISIAGGKLTGYRKMAQRVVDLVSKETHGKVLSCKTKNIPLHHLPFESYQEVKTHISKLKSKFSSWGIPEYLAFNLIHNYGREYEKIVDKMMSFENLSANSLARAECWYAIHHEMIHSVEDFFERRTGKLFFDIESIQKIQDQILDDMIIAFDWSPSQATRQFESLQDLIAKTTDFNSKSN